MIREVQKHYIERKCHMFKKTIACLLALVTVVAGVTTISSSAEAASKPEKPNITGSVGFVASDNDSVGIEFTWDQVKGAKGYQYRYNCFFENGTTKASEFTKAILKGKKNTTAKVSFQDNTNIRFQVRAYTTKKVKKTTKKVFGKWATVDLTEKQVEALIADSQLVDLNGMWDDSVSQRAVLDMSYIGSGEAGSYLATINWANDVESNWCWQLPGKFDQETGVFTFEDGQLLETKFDANGNELSSNVLKEKLSGTMTYDFEKGTLTWEDKDNDRTLVFVKQ